MATKWSTVSISGYGGLTPSDDGAATEANKVKYSTIKTDLTNPLNSALTSALSGLTEAFNDGTVAKSGTYSTTATDHARTIECTSTFTLSLLAAATAGAGYRVKVKNAGTGIITVSRSSTDTIDGATSINLLPQASREFVVNAAGTGYDSLHGPRVGDVVQVVEATPYTTYGTTSADLPNDDTIPQNTEGSEYLTVSITPTKSTNRLRIQSTLMLSADGARTAVVALFQDSTANALTATAHTIPTADYLASVPLVYEMAAGTTSATTFKIRVGRGGGVGSIAINGVSSARRFGGVAACRLSVTEIEA